MDADGLACFQPVDVLGPVAVVGVDRHGHLVLFGIHARDVRCELIGAGLYLFQTALSDGQDDALRRFGLGDDLTAGGRAGRSHRSGHTAGGAGRAGRAAAGQNTQRQNACKEHPFLVVLHIDTFFPLYNRYFMPNLFCTGTVYTCFGKK